MSSINVTNIKHPSSASNNIVLDSSGNVVLQAGTASAPALQPTSDPNTGIFFPAADTIAFAEGGSEAMRIDSSSRLLVGTTTGSQPLSVVSSQSSKIQFGQASDQGGFLFCDGPGAFGISGGGYYNGADWIAKHTASSHIRDDGDATIKFYTNSSLTAGSTFTPTERMRIVNSGEIGVSMTPVASNRLCVRAATDGASILADSAQAQGTSWYLFYGTSGSVAVVQAWIRGDGTYGSRPNVYGGTSDIKLKENIEPASSQWSDVKSIELVNYNFIGDDIRQLGVIAQQVETISPGLVDETKDKDSDGNETGTVTKSVKYSVLYLKAVKALQEAMERIETLEAKVAALEAS